MIFVQEVNQRNSEKALTDNFSDFLNFWVKQDKVYGKTTTK